MGAATNAIAANATALNAVDASTTADVTAWYAATDASAVNATTRHVADAPTANAVARHATADATVAADGSGINASSDDPGLWYAPTTATTILSAEMIIMFVKIKTI